MRRHSIGIVLLSIACGRDADPAQVLRAWSEDGTVHYDLVIDGDARHVALTPRSIGATVVVSDAADDVAGAAQYDEEHDVVYVLGDDPDTLASRVPDGVDGSSVHALELALDGALPDIAVARQDDLPDTMPTTCQGRCGEQRTLCVTGHTNLAILALCDWWYRQCVEMCHPIGGVDTIGVWMP